MATPRINMRQIRNILRLKLDSKLSIRQIKASTQVSVGTIQKILSKATEIDLSWPLPEGFNDNQLAQLFYPRAEVNTSSSKVEIPDWKEVHQELKHKTMTLQLLWEEYIVRFPSRNLGYSRYCARYRQWRGNQKRSMRQIHKAGEKCFVDYCGPTVPIINTASGEIRTAQVFVAVLGASNYTYADATFSQSLPDWIGSHVRMLEFFGGCPEMIIPDNLRSAVSKACRYEPQLNASYQQFAEHYQVAIVPARPYKPKDKSKAEVGVQIVERWILARLRHHSFFSLAEVNHCIRALLEDMNQKPFKQLPGNRLEAFNTLDKPVLKALPAQAYQYIDIKLAKVNIDYHVQYQKHHYSVPHQYVGETIEVHAGESLITIYFRSQQITSHPRKHQQGGVSTNAAHMPEKHEKHHKWSRERLENWALKIGDNVHAWVLFQIEGKKHPEQAYRVCLGLLNLSRDYPSERLDIACAIANEKSLRRLKHVKSILKSNRDKLPQQLPLAVDLPQDHDNIRGPNQFH